MSTWALLVMVLLVLLALGIVLVASRRPRTPAAVAADPQPVGRTVGDLVRDRAPAVVAPEQPADEVAAPAPEAEAPVKSGAEQDGPARGSEPALERRADTGVDAGPVGPPWTRGFVDGVPVEGPPVPKPPRRTGVDPALVARVTSVSPPVRPSAERVERGIVSPAVADAVARAEARRQGERPVLTAVPDLPPRPAPRRGTFVASGAGVAGLALTGFVGGRRDEQVEAAPEPEPPAERSAVEAAADTTDVTHTADTADTAPEESAVDTEAADETVDETTDETTTDTADDAAPAPRAVHRDAEPEGVDAAAGETSDDTAGTAPAAAAAPIAPVETVASVAPVAPLPSPRDGAGAAPRPVVVPAAAVRRLQAVPTSADTAIPTPAVTPSSRPVTLSAVTSPHSTAAPAPAVDARAAEHAAVDLALLRTLGFADPNPRKGASPVVDMSVEHPDDTPEPPRDPVAVAFRVTGRDHAPLPDATVALLDHRGREAASAHGDAAGHGSVEAPRPGGYVLVASADGHQPGVVAVRAEHAGASVEVPLVRSSAIAGRVTDAAAEPVASAALDLLQDGELVASATTGAAGDYRFADLAAGEYTIAVQSGGHAPALAAVRVGEEADAEQDVTLPAAVRG
ncbi:carboxypeptidase-like regulatory domain-containing protein [Pseudonocardia oroxyli]|uniref:Carboxypeptidase regulatory-like domain-containing protein n=1 Tax=Pseudonocardia oroxyli TaxID=366584 RepID=A0A1G7RF35_PSEOR|nr:carboxypeptidase-like regulatory domain-containing protein [Pseudonocardia oroxyli]SDG09436.1 Carboxypeptidase regulatory-like domain-containing protein [Pseudonocardia oroxyli]